MSTNCFHKISSYTLDIEGLRERLEMEANFIRKAIANNC